MNQTDILARLQVIFDDVFVDEVIVTPELKSSDVPEWDSLRQITLSLAAEEVFQVRFDIGEAEETHNVGEFAALIERKLKYATATRS